MWNIAYGEFDLYTFTEEIIIFDTLLDLNLSRYWEPENWPRGKYHEKDEIYRVKFLETFLQLLLQIKYWIYIREIFWIYSLRTFKVYLHIAKSDVKAMLLTTYFQTRKFFSRRPIDIFWVSSKKPAPKTECKRPKVNWHTPLKTLPSRKLCILTLKIQNNQTASH